MKELSIEEKARRYDGAIKRLEDIETGKCQKTFMFTEGLFDYIFPELKESKDDRIRKALIRFHKSTIDIDGIKGDDIVAWLEKQGDHADFLSKIQVGDKVTRNEDGVLVNLSQLKRVAKKDEKQGEQKPNACDGCINRKGCINCENGELRETEQKPWGEEDEKMLKMVIKSCEQCGNEYAYYWLKSLKDRVQPQPKQEWSEDDKTIIDSLLDVLYRIKKGKEPQATTRLIEQHINFIESLKERYAWKPSDEQMMYLSEAIDVVTRAEKFSIATALKELREQLKKLRKE